MSSRRTESLSTFVRWISCCRRVVGPLRCARFNLRCPSAKSSCRVCPSGNQLGAGGGNDQEADTAASSDTDNDDDDEAPLSASEVEL